MFRTDRKVNVEVTRALVNFPYFVLKNEIETGYNVYTKELSEIKQNYVDYKKGAEFYTEGSGGDYVPSNMRFKLAKTLIDKEARFMFSQTPDVNILSANTDKENVEVAKQYQALVDAVLRRTNFGGKLLKSAKDCFIGKRVACLVDFSDIDGIQINFYNSLQFYYETDYGSDRITKFVSFECVNESKSNSEKLYLVKRYEELENEKISFTCLLYDGVGKVKQTVIQSTELDLKYIPVVVILNDGTLGDKTGVSEIESLFDYEAGYSRLANIDVDCERKGMNPIKYAIDIEPKTTKGLSSGAGSFWDLQHNQNMNEPKPAVGVLAPAMNHTESVKTTLDRIKTAMHNEIDVPDISQDGLLSGITSFKALKALYYPLTVRCNEKMMAWKPAIESVVNFVIELSILNKQTVLEKYGLSDLQDLRYNVEIVENYALIDDENEEKDIDLAEIAQNTRSRKSYIKKWRKSEFRTDEQIDEELLQIAIEQSMFDSMSANPMVQEKLNEMGMKQKVDKNIEDVEDEDIEEEETE